MRGTSPRRCPCSRHELGRHDTRHSSIARLTLPSPRRPRHLHPTAVACAALALSGATPPADEPDNRPIWDPDQALATVHFILAKISCYLLSDGNQLADERESFLWGFVNTVHQQTVRLKAALDWKPADLQASSP